jgi:hypothetical protein
MYVAPAGTGSSTMSSTRISDGEPCAPPERCGQIAMNACAAATDVASKTKWSNSGRNLMHDPSFNLRRPFFGCFIGTFSPSCRHRRSMRLSLTCQPASLSNAAIQASPCSSSHLATSQSGGLPYWTEQLKAEPGMCQILTLGLDHQMDPSQ